MGFVAEEKPVDEVHRAYVDQGNGALTCGYTLEGD
jgi:hypothetical protein